MKKLIPMLIITLFACSEQVSMDINKIENIEGKYRLSYYPEAELETTWDYNKIQREELLTIKNDSTFVLERIHPQGGFEIVPMDGTWKIIESKLVLNSTRIFDIGNEYIKETKCSERDDLSNIHWKKE